MTGSVLLREQADGVICITLNRPASLNALNAELRAALTAFWREFRDNPDLKVAIVTGAGERAFSTGRDLKETAGADTVGVRLDYEVSGSYGYPTEIEIGKPVIAAVDGYCMAAGLMVAVACDIRLCTPSAKFGNPQAKRGRGTRMPYHLARAGLPRAVVMDMVMTGEALDAEQALRWGLVSRVVERADLLPTAWSIARRIAENSPTVISGIKRAAEAGLLEMPAHEALAQWDQVTGMMDNTADAVEGAKSFTEGRDAAFRNGGAKT
jgi:enoyl-CoA hydratase/carnithine racemase